MVVSNYLIKNTNIWLKRAKNIDLTNKKILILIGMSVFATIAEMFSISIFLPIFQFINAEGDINSLAADSKFWSFIAKWFEWLNIEISILAFLSISFLFFMGRQIFMYSYTVYRTKVQQQLVLFLRVTIFDKYLDAKTSFHDETKIGNLVNLLSREVNGSVNGTMAPIDLIVYILSVVIYTTLLAFLSWKMTIVSLIVLLVSSLIPRIWMPVSRLMGRELTKANTIASSFLVERIRLPRLIRLSGIENTERMEFNRLSQLQRKYTVLSAILQAKTEFSMEPVVVMLSIIFLYLSYSVLAIPVEIVGLYMVVMLRLMPIVKSIILIFQKINNMLGSIEIVEDRIRAIKYAKELDFGNLRLDKFEKIEFNQVSYRYPGNKIKAISKISFSIKRGEFVAIIGPSGSGKSTLIDLIPSLRKPDSGDIFVNKISIDQYSLVSLRGSIAYAPQTPQIFNGTASDHIRHGKMRATIEEIEFAAKLAGADKFISKLSDGYNTNLGEGAIRLSGGQRQRLDLARTLVSNAPILILDEPTSNLDMESEILFKKTLVEIRDKTDISIIIVTHRLDSIINVDKIIVLDQGEIREVGSHSDLVNQGGWYDKSVRV